MDLPNRVRQPSQAAAQASQRLLQGLPLKSQRVPIASASTGRTATPLLTCSALPGIFPPLHPPLHALPWDPLPSFRDQSVSYCYVNTYAHIDLSLLSTPTFTSTGGQVV